MKITKIYLSCLAILGMPLASYASSIDFITEKNMPLAYSAANCTAKDDAGAFYTAHGVWSDRILRVALPQLLSGANGRYHILCTAQHRQSGEIYQTEFEAIKFSSGERGGSAPEYDQNGKAYGVEIAASSHRDTCYDRVNLIMIPDCLQRYYGNKPYYLSSILGIRDIEINYHSYASHAGVFLEKNPQYKEKE